MPSPPEEIREHWGSPLGSRMAGGVRGGMNGCRSGRLGVDPERRPAGYRFTLQPDFAELRRWPPITAAAGPAYFSLSVGLGAMVTDASYQRSQENLVRLGGLITDPLVAHSIGSTSSGTARSAPRSGRSRAAWASPN
jgi:hypothetical protein